VPSPKLPNSWIARFLGNLACNQSRFRSASEPERPATDLRSGMLTLTRTPDGPYYSQGDERAFWEWVKRISCVHRVWGSGNELYLEIPRRRISDACLRELLALFRRYGIEMTQLAQFESTSNRKWFKNPSKAWYQAVFGGGRSPRRVRSGASRKPVPRAKSRRPRAASAR
jgi:hypothetical protein